MTSYLPRSHLSPTRPGGQEQKYSASGKAIQVPPAWHGLSRQGSIDKSRLSHLLPTNQHHSHDQRQTSNNVSVPRKHGKIFNVVYCFYGSYISWQYVCAADCVSGSMHACVHMNTCVHACMRACVRACLCVFPHAIEHVHACMLAHLYMHACTYLYCECMCVHMRTCECTQGSMENMLLNRTSRANSSHE